MLVHSRTQVCVLVGKQKHNSGDRRAMKAASIVGLLSVGSLVTSTLSLSDDEKKKKEEEQKKKEETNINLLFPS